MRKNKNQWNSKRNNNLILHWTIIFSIARNRQIHIPPLFSASLMSTPHNLLVKTRKTHLRREDASPSKLKMRVILMKTTYHHIDKLDNIMKNKSPLLLHIFKDHPSPQPSLPSTTIELMNLYQNANSSPRRYSSISNNSHCQIIKYCRNIMIMMRVSFGRILRKG